ncbi:MAG: metallophosphoesterase family protein [Chthonomonadales bacterium]
MKTINWQIGLMAFVAASITSCTHQKAGASGISKGPYLQNPTQTEITVCWVSDIDSIGSIGYSVKSGGDIKKVQESVPTSYHKVHLTGLSAYTRYIYTVTCEGRIGKGEFITAAKPNQPFKFIAYGDTRTQPKVHESVLKSMAQFQPDFVIQSGDLVANGEEESQWKVFWETASSFMSNVPYFPALGNHERNASPYFKYFDVKNEYSFDYGNTHFVALDTNRDSSEYPAQNEWLKKDLAAHQSATWRVVFFHHTVHTCVDKPDRRAQSKLLAARLEPIFKAGHVQLVVNGHDHDYQHHFNDGIHYVVSGGGGAPLYSVTPDTEHVVKAKSVHNHVRIEVNGGTMKITAIEPNGDVIESFEVKSK